MEYKDGKVHADWTDIKEYVKLTGLRSKKTRKILKRWKILIHALLNDFLDKQNAKTI